MEVNYFTMLYWFCHTSTWIHHRYTHVPHPEPPFLLPPHTIPLGHPSAPAPSIQYLCLLWKIYLNLLRSLSGFHFTSASEESACNEGDSGSFPGSGRSPGEGNGNPLQYSWVSLVANSKESACNAGDLGSILGLGRSPGERNSYPLQYSCLENPMDRRAWRATVHGVTKSWTWPSDWARIQRDSPLPSSLWGRIGA